MQAARQALSTPALLLTCRPLPTALLLRSVVSHWVCCTVFSLLLCSSPAGLRPLPCSYRLSSHTGSAALSSHSCFAPHLQACAHRPALTVCRLTLGLLHCLLTPALLLTCRPAPTALLLWSVVSHWVCCTVFLTSERLTLVLFFFQSFLTYTSGARV